MISVGGLDDATVLVGEFDESLDRSWRRRDLLLDRNVFRGRRAEIAELPRLHQHAAFERADDLVVRLHGAIEPAAQVLEVSRHRRDAVVELLAELADVGRVLRNALFAPA